jgi:hypothetical protein
MGLDGSTLFCQAAVFALAGGVCLPTWAAEPGPASEKIQFSSHGDALKLPGNDEDPDRIRPFESLERGNSMSGVLEPINGGPLALPPPQGTPNQRMTELWVHKLDQKKNWIYAKPENLGDSPTAEQVMQVRDYDLSGATKRRDAMAEFLDGKAERLAASSLTPLNPDRSDSPVLPEGNSGSRPDFGRTLSLPETGGSRRVAPERPFLAGLLPTEPQPTTPAANNPGGFLLANPTGGTPDAARLPGSIRELLATPDGLNPLALGFDPINLRVDTTRQEINPITPRRLTDLSLDKRLDITGVLTAPGMGGSDHPSALDELASKLMGPSSLAPAVTAPVAAEVAHPVTSKAGVLQVPTRKF